MNFLDILIAIPLLYFIYKGWKRGLIFEMGALLGVVVGAWAAVHMAKWVSELLKLEGDTSVLVAFFIIFVGVLFLAFFLARALEGALKLVKAGALNKLAGATFGMLKCLCVLSVFINFVLLIDRHEFILSPETKEKSILFSPTHTVGNKLTTGLKEFIEKKRAEHCDGKAEEPTAETAEQNRQR